MNPRIIIYKEKDGEIKEGQYQNEDGTGYYLLVKGRKTLKHVKFSQVIGEKK